MSYKPVPRCPEDKTILKGMVQSTSTEETYHCPKCDTYWHYHWEKHREIGKTGYKWRLAYVRDDFGSKHEWAYVS